ncbi:YfiR family protein [Mucilaginibacter sp. UR6-11]|uniref:YfiR family protein n=1 Tax=Mucilaginibacter sp. UR6-11 TaxID=1435644 RepID=UPI001E32C04A|nr:YfiR family protein [Mucilaginibacter sp. UR6-11]MCC8426511.1 YfiR family protein [Mucilaginibacter sp. UR6-11]
MAKAKYTTAGLLKAIRLLAVMLFFAFSFNISKVQAQHKPSLEYQVKAAFIFNFTKFVNWPSSVFKSADAPFIIGIIGDDPFGPYLDELVKGEKIGTHKIIVVRYTDVNDATNCHMLFINANPVIQQNVLALTNNQKILTVSDSASLGTRGSNISFFKQNNKVKIEININATKNSKLEISSKLLSIAKLN